MALALSINKTEYILKSDKDLDKKEQTLFFIKPLTARQFATVQDAMKISGDDKRFSIDNIGTYTLDILQMGLVGWDNFLDIEGKPVKWNEKNMDKNIDRIPADARFELSTQVMDSSNLKETQSLN